MSTPKSSTDDLLCPLKGRQIEQAWASHRAGDSGAFLQLAGDIYEWLDRRVTTILRGYPRLGVPADEVLADHVLARLERSLSRNQADSCEQFVLLVSGEVRWAIRDILRGRARDRTASLEEAGPDDGDPDWLDDPRTANPLEELLAREEGERFAHSRARFDEAAASLPEPLRQAFCLRYYAGLPLKEIAAEVGVTDKTAHQRIKDALDSISRKLVGRPFPGKPPQFKGTVGESEGRSRCRTGGKEGG